MIKHVSGESVENQATVTVVASYVDRKGPEFAATLMKQSTKLKDHNKFTPAQTAAIIAGTNMTNRTMERLRIRLCPKAPLVMK